ncbi:unnamed protein product, partial [Rotaria sp. Silwood2]
MSTNSKLENGQIDASLSYDKLNGGSISNNGISKNDVSDQSMPFKMPRAPPHVYSCFVVNGTAQSIECTLQYSGRPGEEKFDQL